MGRYGYITPFRRELLLNVHMLSERKQKYNKIINTINIPLKYVRT